MSQMIDLTVPSTVPGRTLHAFRCVPEGEREQIMLASVSGVGAVKNVTLGVFNSEKLQYESQQFSVSV